MIYKTKLGFKAWFGTAGWPIRCFPRFVFTESSPRDVKKNNNIYLLDWFDHFIIPFTFLIIYFKRATTFFLSLY